MKIVISILAICFCALSTFAGNRNLTDFDGSRSEIPGLFGEPFPETFFTKNLVAVYEAGVNYSGNFNLRNSGPGLITSYLINESEVQNVVVISAVSLDERKTRNFVVQIEPLSFESVNITPLKHYDFILVMSLSEFQIQLDYEGLNLKHRIPEVVIEPPVENREAAFARLDGDEQNLRSKADCYAYISSRTVCITNDYNGVTVKADARIRYNSFFGYTYLNVHYPVGGSVWHDDIGPYYNCTSSTGTPRDQYITYSSATGRSLEWNQIRGLIGGGFFPSSANATCISPDSGNGGYNCVGNDGTRATWTITR